MKQRIRTNSWAGIIFLCWLGCILSTQAYAQQNALDFDGVGDIVESQVMISNSYTKEALVFLRDRDATDSTINNNNIASGNSTTANTAFWIPTGNGRRLAAGHDGQWFTVQDTAVFPTGRWIHVAVTFNANGNVLTLYKNGVQVAQASNVRTAAYFSEGGDSLQIGGFIDDNFLKGVLDEVRIWNYPRTAEEIQASISQPLAGTETGLIAYYSFNQGTPAGDNTAIDSLDNNASTGKNGVLSGFALTGNTSNFIASDALNADLLPPSGYTVAIDQPSIDTTNHTAISFTLSGAQDAVAYYYTITDTAGTVVSGSGEVAAAPQQVTGIDVSSLSDGELLLSLILADAVGNTGAAAMATVNKDSEAPSAMISSTYDSVTNQSPIPLTITFNEKVKGFAVSDLTVTNGSAAELATEDSVVFTANITPVAEGQVTVEIPVNAVTDAQGSANTAATSFSILYDLSALTVTLSTQADSIFTQDALDLTITFSDTVSGFELGDLSIMNGTADTLVTADSVVFTTGITPTEAGPVTVELPAEVATSRLGNANEAATPLSRTYQPGGEADVTITTTASNPTNQSPIPVKITFSSAVSDFVVDDLTIANGVADNLVTTDDITFTTNIAPAKDSLVSVFIAQDAVTGIGASDTLSIVYDGTPPSATLSTEASDTVSGKFVVMVTFSEAITGFDSADFALDNAVAGNVQTEDSTVFTADISPGATGAVAVSLDSGVVTDLAGNGNLATDSLRFIFDDTKLTANISTSADSLSNVSPIPFTITFNRAVIGFNAESIALQNATVDTLITTDSITFEAAVIPDMDTIVSLSVPENSVSDADGTGNTASNTIEVAYDGTAPTVTISTTEEDTIQTSPFVATITFSEKVSGFDPSDLAKDSASLANFQTSDSIVFTVDVTPVAGSTVTLTVADSAAMDAAGNASTGASFSIFYQEAVTGIEDFFVHDATLKMYPVPSSQHLNIVFQLKQAAKVSIELRSISGQLIKRKALGKTVAVDETLWLSNVPNGVYVLTLYMDDNRMNKKIIIKR